VYRGCIRGVRRVLAVRAAEILLEVLGVIIVLAPASRPFVGVFLCPKNYPRRPYYPNFR
jgi:hypothetical protein